MKFNIDKFLKNRESYTKKMIPDKFTGSAWIFALGFGAIFLDLEIILNIDFKYILAFLDIVFCYSFGYCACWVLFLVYYAIASKVYAKKYPQYSEVLLKNEDK